MNEVEIAAQRRIDWVLLGQEMVVGTLGPTHPNRYLGYVHDLVRLTTGGSSARLLWPDLCTRYQLAYSWREKERASVASPIQLDTEDRRHAITLAVHVLADWPVGVAEALLALDLWGSEHVWRAEDPLWNAVRLYYEANALAACPPSFRPRRPYSSAWQL
ncbi:MAG: hypothetical protein ACREM1_20620 [Longimicrobiales bacterium]